MTNAVGTGLSLVDFLVTVGPKPTIKKVSPAAAVPGALIKIKGTNLDSTAVVRLNGVSLQFVILSAKELGVTVPTGVTSGPLWLRAAGGTVTSARPFVPLIAPTITSMAPLTGPPQTVVTLTGHGFTSIKRATFGVYPKSKYKILSDASMTVIVPNSMTTGQVTIIGKYGSTTSDDAFTYS